MKYRATLMNNDDNTPIDILFGDTQANLISDIDKLYGNSQRYTNIRVLIQAVVSDSRGLWQLLETTHDYHLPEGG